MTRLPPFTEHAARRDGFVNERKFVGDARDRDFVLALLDSRLQPDREHASGHVNSVYFDTLFLRSLAEKADGDNLKRKIRVRWYGRPAQLAPLTPVFLEVKRRFGSAREKVRVAASAPADLLARSPLRSPAWTALLAARVGELGEPVGTEFSPVCRIEYDRVRFDDPESGSRVSVDWDVMAFPDESRFPWAAPVALNVVVCEFKNRGGVPPRWSEALHRAGLRLRSFSKYGECMDRIVSGLA